MRDQATRAEMGISQRELATRVAVLRRLAKALKV
jgi:DNA-binding XRE family transcriptional regulator